MFPSTAVTLLEQTISRHFLGEKLLIFLFAMLILPCDPNCERVDGMSSAKGSFSAGFFVVFLRKQVV
jgi:hypothetical protein